MFRLNRKAGRAEPEPRRKRWLLFVLPAILVGGLLFVAPARASGISDVIYEILGWITGLFVQFLGAILVKIIDLIVRVAQYNDFGNADVVNNGWVVMRDVSNMFFIMVLLVIAFGTVLKWETYRYNRLLGRLVLMAILINFSKFIALFFIDISQVIMLTFVHAFQDAAAGNLTTGFGVRSMVEFAQAGVGEISLPQVVIAMVLAVIMLLIAVIVSLIILLMLIQRIIAFWLLVVLSPAAYLAAALPPGGLRRFNSTWWQQFGKYWSTGPLLAFFLWLALTVISLTSNAGANETATFIPLNTAGESLEGGVVNVGGGAGQEIPAAASSVSTTQNLFNYIVTIGILMAAVVSAQQLGGAVGGFAGQALGKIRQVGGKATERVLRAPGGAYGWVASKVKSGRLPFGLGQVTAGLEIRPGRIYKNIRQGMTVKKEKEEREGTALAAGKMIEKGGFRAALYGLGTPDFAQQYLHGFLYNKGIRKMFRYKPEKAKDLAGKEKGVASQILEKRELAERLNPGEYFVQHYETEKKEAAKNLVLLDEQLNRPQVIQQELAKRQQLFDKAEAEGKDDEAAKHREIIQRLNQENDDLMKDPNRTTRLQGDRLSADNRLSDAQNKLSLANYLTQRGNYTKLDTEGRNLIDSEANKLKTQINEIKGGGLSNVQRKDVNHELVKIDEDIQKLDQDILKKKGLKQVTTDEESRRKELDMTKQGLLHFKATPEQAENNKQLLVELERQLAKKQAHMAGPYVSVTDRVKIGEEVKQLEVEQKTLQTAQRDIASEAPQAYYAKAEMRSAINEEARKIDTTNEHELIALFQSALKNNDKFLAAAIAKRATEVSHINELVNDAGFPANQSGLNQFMNDVFVKKLGFSKQMAYGLQNDMSNTAERNNHWTFGQSVGVKNGLFYQRSPEEQTQRAIVEMSKRDPERTIREGNRLMYGGEDSEGNFLLGGQGLMLIRKFYPQMLRFFSNNRFNKNAAMKLVTDDSIKKLERLMELDSTIDRRQFTRFLGELKNYAAGSIDELSEELAAVTRVLKET